MITQTDCMLLLMKLKKDGINVNEQMSKLVNSVTVPIDVVQFINSHRQMDVSKFYEKMRKSYNDKHSRLYGNIVKEISTPKELPIILASLSLQILLFSQQVEDVPMFFEHTRFNEIQKCLTVYSKSYDLKPATEMLRYIKADVKSFDSIRSN